MRVSGAVKREDANVAVAKILQSVGVDIARLKAKVKISKIVKTLKISNIVKILKIFNISKIVKTFIEDLDDLEVLERS